MKQGLIIILLLAGLNVSAQESSFSKVLRYEGDTLIRNDLIRNLCFDTASNNVFFCLNTITHYGTLSNARFLNEFFRCDIDGNIVTRKIDSIAGYDVIYMAVAELDGYLYWTGWIYHGYPQPDTANQRALLTKTDKDFNVVWHRQYENDHKSNQTARLCIDADKKEIILLVNEMTDYDSPEYPIEPSLTWLQKVDTAGNMIWKRRIGAHRYDLGVGIALSENGYMVSGRTFGWDAWDGAHFIEKTDTASTPMWHQLYAPDAYSTAPQGMVKFVEGGNDYFITAGEASMFPSDNRGKGYINKVNSEGEEMWRRYTGSDSIAQGFFNLTNADGGYVATGFTLVNPYGERPLGWFVKYDQNGNEVWNRSVTANPRAYDHEYLYNIISLPDGGFMASGSTFGIDSRGRWTQDAWLVKVDSLGCMDEECRMLSSRKERMLNDYHLTVYPNPTQGYFTLQSSKQLPSGYTIMLYDVMGRAVNTDFMQKGKEVQCQVGKLAAGMYFLEVSCSDGIKRIKVNIL